MRIAWLSVIAAIVATGCEDHLPSVEVSSAHFSYRARSAERIPSNILQRLERHRADVMGYLGLNREDRITYYLFDDEADLARHSPCEGSCVHGGAIYASQPFIEHELVHSYLYDVNTPAPLVAEGIANALNCYGDSLARLPDERDWRVVASLSPGDRTFDVYIWSYRLVLELLRTYGASRFMDFYRSSHGTLDPALLGLDFARAFDRRIEDVWSVIEQNLGTVPSPICPCRGEMMTTDGVDAAITWSPDYRVVPSVAGQDVILAIRAKQASLGSCVSGWSAPLAARAFATTDPAEPTLVLLHDLHPGLYLSLRETGAVTGRAAAILSADCAQAGLLEVPEDMKTLAIATPSGPDASRWYARIDAKGAPGLFHSSQDAIRVRVCADCSLSLCTEVAPNAMTWPQSPYVLELQRPPTADAHSPHLVTFAVSI